MIELRQYQPPAIDWISRRRRGIVRARAGAGKTIIAAAAIHAVLHRRPRAESVRIGWLANTLEQVQQANDALDLFPMNATRKVACAAGNPDMSECDVLICDECHHAAESPLWRGIIGTCTGAVWGFTATPCMDDPEKHAALLELFGGEMFTVDPEAVAKQLAHGRVILLSDTDEGLRESIDDKIAEELDRLVPRMLHFKKEEFWAKHSREFCDKFRVQPIPGRPLWEAVCKSGLYNKAMEFLGEELRKEVWPRVAYRACLDIGISTNAKRNLAIARAALAHPAATKLILVNNKEHGAHLAEQIPKSVCAHSKMGVKKRRDAMANLRSGDLLCMIATSLADEGFDCPRASVLIMACGGKAAGRVEQRTGRVLRAFQDKTEGLIYDFTDTFHPLSAKQSKKRQTVYRELGYTVETSSPQMSLL